MLAKSLVAYHTRQLRQSPATGIFLTVGWLAGVLLTFISGQLIATNRAELTGLFTYMPWILAVLIPTLTMPVASENRRGVAERLLTLPHTPAQRLFSRFAVLWALIGIWILGFWPLIATLYYLGSPDLGPIATGLLGSLLLAAPMLAISLALCLRAKTGVSGLLASLAACLILLLLGTSTVAAWFSAVPGLGWLPSATYLTLLGAYQPFTVGLLNLSATLLLIGLTFIFLGLAQKPFRITNNENRITIFGGLLTLLALIPALNWMQLDTTAESLYTASPATVQALNKLPQPVTFTVHFSGNNPDVPPSVHAYVHSLTNSLRRLRAASNNVIVKTNNTDASTAAAITALQAGATEQSLPTGTTYFAALTAEISGTQAIIPALQPSRQSVQEYDVMSLLNNTLNPANPPVAILSNGSRSLAQPVQEDLRKSFEIHYVNPIADLPKILSTTTVLLVPDDTPMPVSATTAIRNFLGQGGNVVLLADAFSRNPASVTSSPTDIRLSTLLPEFGLTFISSTIVADPSLATLATQPGAGASAYPYWLQLTAGNLNAELPFTAGINKLFVPESGSITLNPSTPYTLTPLITTSPNARVVPLETFQNTPAELASSNLPPATGRQLIAAMSSGAFATSPHALLRLDGNVSASPSQPANSAEPDATELQGGQPLKYGNLIVFADADWLTATSITQSPENLNLLTNILNYVTGQGVFSQLRAKGANPRTLTRIESMANRLAQQTTVTEQKIATRLYEVTQTMQSGTNEEALTKAQEEEFTLRQQLRNLRQQTRESLQGLENALLLLNLALMPTIAGVLFFLQRRRQRRKATTTS